MKTCANCAVTVSGDPERCPLCQSALSGEGEKEGEVFPYVPTVRHEHGFLYRLLLFCSAAVVITAFTVNGMLPESGFWSLFVVAGVACVWLSLSIAIRKRHSLLKNISYQVTVVSLAALLWDLWTGWHGWSADFVVPIAFVSAMTTTTVLARVFKMNAGDYIIYLVLLILYGIIPIAFVLTGLSDIVYPSLICVAASLLSLVSLCVFQGGDMVEELKRRLHL